MRSEATVQCDAMRCDAVRCDAMRCDAVRYPLQTNSDGRSSTEPRWLLVGRAST